MAGIQRMIGGGGYMFCVPLYTGTADAPVLQSFSSAVASDISIGSMVDGTWIETTTPSFSGDPNTIAFATKRTGQYVRKYFRDNCPKTAAVAPITGKDEAGNAYSINIGGSLIIKKLIIWCATSLANAQGGLAIGNTAGKAHQYLAAVGYWERSNRDFATAADTPIDYTWTFTCEKPTDEERTAIMGMASNAMIGGELGYGTTPPTWVAAQGAISSPFADWDSKEQLQEFFSTIS